MWFPFRAQSCDTRSSSSQGTLGLCQPQSKARDGRKRQSLISRVGDLEAKNVHFKEVFIHVARQRDAVPADQSCWLTALRPAKGGQQVVLQSLGSILGNAEPCRVSGCQWDLSACASLQTVDSCLKGRMTFPVAGIDMLPLKRKRSEGHAMASILCITQGARQLIWDESLSSQDTAAGTQSRNNRNNRCFGCLSLIITPVWCLCIQILSAMSPAHC